MVKISDYTTITSLADEDLLDISQWDSVGLDFNTKSISWEDMFTEIAVGVHDSGGDDAVTDPSVNSRTFFYTASAPGGTMYLPNPSPVAGMIVSFVRVGNAGTAASIGSSGGATLNGAASYATSTVLYAVETAYFDGTNWFIG